MLNIVFMQLPAVSLAVRCVSWAVDWSDASLTRLPQVSSVVCV